jgi:hypothetical protein
MLSIRRRRIALASKFVPRFISAKSTKFKKTRSMPIFTMVSAYLISELKLYGWQYIKISAVFSFGVDEARGKLTVLAQSRIGRKE